MAVFAPLMRLLSAALRAETMVAAVVKFVLTPAICTGMALPAEHRSAASGDLTQGQPLMRTQASTALLLKAAAVLTEDTLQGGPRG